VDRIQHYAIDEGSTGEVVRINFNPEPPRHHPRSFQARPQPPHHGVQLTVQFGGSDATEEFLGPTEVTLRSPGGLSAGELSRFPWNRWLRVAEATSRLRSQHTIAGLHAANQAGEDALRASRPGRKGHDPHHYPHIARRYTELTADGALNPVQQIADEHHVSRHTAAGWVREARRRGLLPPARHGRAG
jgi:hypothetical protein